MNDEPKKVDASPYIQGRSVPSEIKNLPLEVAKEIAKRVPIKHQEVKTDDTHPQNNH